MERVVHDIKDTIWERDTDAGLADAAEGVRGVVRSETTLVWVWEVEQLEELGVGEGNTVNDSFSVTTDARAANRPFGVSSDHYWARLVHTPFCKDTRFSGLC